MIIDDVRIPDDLLDAMKNNNFVVFVGAGVSMGNPTCLPSFKKLVELIQSNTGETYDESETYERFLGRLNSKNIDVHKKAAEQLIGKNLKYNDLHSYIINLFKNIDDIKIVTTNYDTMLEQALETGGHSGIDVYNTPALPLGDNFKGIVHIHGNVQNPDSMILTDEDFGKAYITEGYVSRFLIKLFENNNVLFIGYSYDDTIVKYLTRAITTYGNNKRFILIGSESNDFDLLGIKSVCYGDENFKTLYKIVNHLGEVNHRSLLDWKDIIQDYALNPPIDSLLRSEIEDCLLDEAKSFILSKTIHGEKWFEWLYKNKVFDAIFNESLELTKNDMTWLNWFVDEFLGKNDDLIYKTILNYHNYVNDSLISKIFEKLINEKFEISNQNYCKYVALFHHRIKNGFILYHLIITSYKRKLYKLSFVLFKKMFDFKVCVKSKLFSIEDEIEYICQFLYIDYSIDIIWDNVGDHLAKKFPKDFVKFAIERITSIYDQYQMIEMADNKNPLNSFFFSLERKEYNNDFKNILFLLCQGACNAIIQVEDVNFVHSNIFECLQSESALLKNLGLKLLRVSTSFAPDEKCTLLLKYVGVYASHEKEQMFLLIKEIFNDLSDEMQEKLLEEINKGNDKSKTSERTRAYEIFNWCAWLEKNNIKNNKITFIKNQILKKYTYFKERNHPELNVETMFENDFVDKSIYSEEEIKKMKIDDLLLLLKNFKEDLFNGITKEALYNALDNCLKSDFQWSYNILQNINKCFNGAHPIWQSIILKVPESEYSIEDHIQLLKLLIENKDLVKFNDLELAWCIEKLLNNVKKIESDSVLDLFFSFTMQIWKYGEKKSIDEYELMTKCLNCSVGIILMIWIKLLSQETEFSREKKYYSLFEKLLDKKSQYYDQTLCILVGNVRFLYHKNLEWCDKYIVPYITSKDHDEFVASWEGIAYQSSELYSDFARNYQDKYLEVITRIKELNNSGRAILVKQYSLLMIYVVDNPLEKYIPTFLNIAEKKDKLTFIHTINTNLNKFKDSEKKELWNKWLKEYWINRINNTPISLEDEESIEMLNWIVNLGELFPEAVNVIQQGMKIQKLNYHFIYQVLHSDLIQNYSNDVAKLFIYILNNETEIDSIEYSMKELVSCLKFNDNSIKSELQEALLKRHVTLECV